MKKRLLAAIAAVCVMLSSMGMETLAAATATEQSKMQTASEAGNVDYVYLEKENVSLSETQKVLVGVRTAGGKIKDAVLHYHKEGANASLQKTAKTVAEDAVVFSISYTKKSQTGVYVLDKIVYTVENGKQYTVDLKKNKTIKYGVERQIEANPDGRVYEESAGIETSVVTMDENGNAKTQRSIADALEEVGAGAGTGTGSGIIGKVRANRAGGVSKTTAAQNMVIVLDPGHGGSDPGATRSYNGVAYYERDIVLKIAKYCKKELEKYANVKVYLTRTDNTSQLMNRLERTQYALSLGANVIVSFHINSTGETYTSASGSLVYCPYADTASGYVSQELAKKILEKLEKLGLKNRGIVVDESLGMVLYPKANAVPGILIEHAFVNNGGDVANFLSSDAKLKKLGVADATGIAEYFNLKKKDSKYQDYGVNSGKMTVKGNKEKTKYTVSISNLPKAYAVKFAVWSEKNGQDDLKWYQASLNSSGVWKGSFEIKNFKEIGAYHIHAYVVNTDGGQVCAAIGTVNIAGPSATKIAVQSIKPDKGTFKVRITGLTSDAPIEKVTVKAWSQSDKKDSYTYTAALQNNGTYLATINNKRHKYNYGTYQVYVYATDKNGITKRIGKKKVKLERPALNLKIKANKTQTTYSIISDASRGIKSMRMAVWSEKKGQGKLKWYAAKKKSDGTWRANVKIADHKAAGTYRVHIYGTTSAGEEIFLGSSSFEVTAPSIGEMESKKVNLEEGTAYIYLKDVKAKAGVKAVTVKAWSQPGKSDLYTYTAKCVSDGKYRIKLDIENHNNNHGVYQLVAYVKDNRGITGTMKMKQALLEPEEP